VTSYYIYYRIAPQQAARLADAVGEIQAAVRDAYGVSCRLLRRADGTDTWMEIYEGVSDAAAFETALRQAVADAGFDSLLAADSVRHVERFVDVQVK
jgi:Domain of unknown function (DUF4936)